MHPITIVSERRSVCIMVRPSHRNSQQTSLTFCRGPSIHPIIVVSEHRSLYVMGHQSHQNSQRNFVRFVSQPVMFPFLFDVGDTPY